MHTFCTDPSGRTFSISECNDSARRTARWEEKTPPARLSSFLPRMLCDTLRAPHPAQGFLQRNCAAFSPDIMADLGLSDAH